MSTNYTAVWRPGSGGQRWVARVPFDDFKARDQTNFNDGYRLSILQVDGDGYSAVWHPGGGWQHWQSGMSFDEIVTQDATFFKQGRRLQWIGCVHDVDSSDGWYAVWRSGSGAQFWRTGISFDDFKQQDSTFFAEGLRLVCMRHDAGSSEKYLGLWRPGSGAQHWWSTEPVDLNALAQKNAQMEAQGLRLVALPLSGLNAIWKEGTGSSPFLFTADFDTFKATDADLFAKGFLLSHFSTGVWP